MNIETFIKELQKININPTKEQLDNLEIYKNMLQEYNKKFNLTAIINDEDIYLKHFYDSLTLSKFVDLTKEQKLLDIGTGAGFPGLVLRIFFPALNITLIDSNHKKITFLETVIKKLNLKNIVCLNTRAENLNTNYREYFDIITSRAVSHLRVLSELSLPYLKINGLFLPMKSNITDELEESKFTIEQLSSKILDIYEFNLPLEESKRTIIKITKLSKIPSIYPRPYDKIVKRPLNK
ncbi:MAG: 16S rRNA (guanine(527)-N(7))-methyltransferase RsmG [Ruminococcus sp.]|nr:16S rRNA (guanine(527)-N(7))-methyltransferase RsmG [Ruminococcus sp.]